MSGGEQVARERKPRKVSYHQSSMIRKLEAHRRLKGRKICRKGSFTYLKMIQNLSHRWEWIESLGKSDDIDIINGTQGSSQFGRTYLIYHFPQGEATMKCWWITEASCAISDFYWVHVLFIVPESAFFLFPWFPFKSHLLWSLPHLPRQSELHSPLCSHSIWSIPLSWCFSHCYCLDVHCHIILSILCFCNIKFYIFKTVWMLFFMAKLRINLILILPMPHWIIKIQLLKCDFKHLRHFNI